MSNETIEIDGCRCGHCGDEGKGGEFRLGGWAVPVKKAAVFGAALALWALGIWLMAHEAAGWRRYLPLAPLAAAYLLAGLPVLRAAAANLARGKALDENFLMAIATVGAFAVGEWEEAVGVMIFYMIGELVQDAAVNRSRRSIDALLALKPDRAAVLRDGVWVDVAAGDVAPGALVRVKPGERIPLDGIVVEGEGGIDAAMLSGESRPIPAAPGVEVRSGTISLEGILTIRTTKTAEESSAAKIIELVQSAGRSKAKPEKFITSFARWYTPIVVGCALALAVLPPLFGAGAFSAWFYRALILLVISCPCALVVSIPLAYFAGIGGLSRRGIMVKGASHLDSLCAPKNIAFDKTGTLTRGSFSILGLEPAPGVTRAELAAAALTAESGSNHPIAKAVAAELGNGKWGMGYGGDDATVSETNGITPGSQKDSLTETPLPTSHFPLLTEAPLPTSHFPLPTETPLPTITGYREIPGRGVEASTDRGLILAGNPALLAGHGVEVPPACEVSGQAHTAVYIAGDGAYLGRILIGDSLKEGAAGAVAALRRLGVADILMFTGDEAGAASDAAATLGITQVESGLLPADKLARVEELTKTGTTVFVGDGINDAPVLARADVGIAMGSGADAAIEAADVIIMTGDPGRVPEAIVRARKTRRIIMENVVFALGTKAAFIALAVLGLANMWIAIIGDVGVCLAAVLNSTRSLKA